MAIGELSDLLPVHADSVANLLSSKINPTCARCKLMRVRTFAQRHIAELNVSLSARVICPAWAFDCCPDGKTKADLTPLEGNEENPKSVRLRMLPDQAIEARLVMQEALVVGEGETANEMVDAWTNHGEWAVRRRIESLNSKTSLQGMQVTGVILDDYGEGPWAVKPIDVEVPWPAHKPRSDDDSVGQWG